MNEPSTTSAPSLQSNHRRREQRPLLSDETLNALNPPVPMTYATNATHATNTTNTTNTTKGVVARRPTLSTWPSLYLSICIGALLFSIVVLVRSIGGTSGIGSGVGSVRFGHKGNANTHAKKFPTGMPSSKPAFFSLPTLTLQTSQLTSTSQTSSTPPTPNYETYYDVCSIGAGLSGTVSAERAASLLGQRVLVLDSRGHVGGNCYDYWDDFGLDPVADGADEEGSEDGEHRGILRNLYGSHLFHTNIQRVWEYVNSNPRVPKWKRWYHHKYGKIVLPNNSNHKHNKKENDQDNYDNYVYVPIPPNIETVNRLFDLDIRTEQEMEEWLEGVRVPCPEGGCVNAEQMAKSRVGEELYHLIFEGYTIKQWDKHPRDLDPSVTARIPVRTNFDPRYFSDKWQALPSEGYTAWFGGMLDHPLIDVVLGVDFFDSVDVGGGGSVSVKEHLEEVCGKIVYTGPIDRYFEGMGLERLEYRGIKFVEERYLNHPGNVLPSPVLNYPGLETNYTRAVEYKQYLDRGSPHSIVVKEESTDANADGATGSDAEPYYPVPSKRNHDLYAKYQKLAKELEDTGKIQFVGRLANYKYFNMDQAIENALTMFYNSSLEKVEALEEEMATIREKRGEFMRIRFPEYKESIDKAIEETYGRAQTQTTPNDIIPEECTSPLWQGEFGMELRVMIPWAHSKLQSCKSIATRGVVGTKYLYFFSSNHTIVKNSRHGFSKLPEGNPFRRKDVHGSSLPKKMPDWDPPPFKDFFHRPSLMNELLHDNKPLVVILNKYNREWDHGPVNFMSGEVVRDLLDVLTKKYTVLYKRYTDAKLEDDNEKFSVGRIVDLNDKEMIRRRYPQVLLFEDFADHITDAEDYNLLFFAFMSMSERFLSIQGGNAVVGSYFGGTNVILIKQGAELDYGDYQYFHRFSNADVRQTTHDEEFIDMVKTLF